MTHRAIRVCPRCGSNTENGFLNTNAWLWWSNTKPNPSMLVRDPRWDAKETLAADFMHVTSFEGTRCRSCGLMIVWKEKTQKTKLRGIRCPHCDSIYVYAPDLGKEIRCQNCGKLFKRY